MNPYDHIPKEMLIEGWFFRTESDQYFIQFLESKYELNKIVSVSVLDEILEVENKTKVTVPEFLLKPCFELDIWPKYYFPTFTANQYQWYHEPNHIESMFQVMAFAYELGVKEVETY